MKNLMKNLRSQSSAEFVVLVSFVLFSFTMFFIAIQEANSEKIYERKNLAVKEIAFTIQDEINLASESVDGYQRTFDIPSDLNGLEYEVYIVDGVVYVKTVDDRYAISLPIKNVTGNIILGDNLIRKFEGEVRLNG